MAKREPTAYEQFWGVPYQIDPDPDGVARPDYLGISRDPLSKGPIHGSWHYTRTCQWCMTVWGGLHCPHDGFQHECPNCRRRPDIMPEPPEGCDCQFDFEEG